MRKNIAILTIGAALGAAGFSLAHDEDDGGTVRVISEAEIREKFEGKDSKVTFVEVSYEPGEGGKPHRHPGPIFGYVLEGEFELALDDQPAKRLKAGETFYEPGGALHRVGRNPAAKGRNKVLAVLVSPKNGGPVAVPEPAN